MIESIFELLGQKISQVFGKDCASASILMFISLGIRLIVILSGTEKYLPLGLIFASPYLVQMLMRILPFIEETPPLLTIRIAETLLGRIPASSLTVVIPAHFIGSIFGTICFYAIIPFKLSKVFDPIAEYNYDKITGSFMEIGFVCIYVCFFIIIPEMLEVNKLPRYLLIIPLCPFLFVGYDILFNPTALYALWFLNGSANTLQLERLIGPLVGSLLAGLICSKVVPDDPLSYVKPKKRKLFL